MLLLLQLQRFFVPTLIGLLAWAVWRVIFRKDLAVGLVLYLGLVIIVDSFYNTGIYLPGLGVGSIRYSEVCAIFLLANRPHLTRAASSLGTEYGPAQNNPVVANSDVANASDLPRRGGASLVGMYFVLLFLSTLYGDSVLDGIFEFRRIIVPQIIAFLIAKRGLHSQEDYRRFLLSLAALALIVSLFVFWDVFFDRWLLKSEMLSKPEYWANRKQKRFGGMFLNPNLLGAFVVLVVPLLFVGVLNERGLRRRFFILIAVLGLLFSLVETQSRGPLISFGVSLIVFLLAPCGQLSRWRRMVFLAICVVVFSFFMPGFYEHGSERFSSMDKETSTSQRSRETVWLYTRKILADHPFGGIGFGERQFLAAMADYGFKERYDEESLDNPHNSYLQIAVYAGIPALIVFLLANAALLFKASRVCARRARNPNAETAFGMAVGIFGFLLCVYPDMHLFTQNVAPVYWVMFGLLLSLSRPIPLPRLDEDRRSNVGNPSQ